MPADWQQVEKVSATAMRRVRDLGRPRAEGPRWRPFEAYNGHPRPDDEELEKLLRRLRTGPSWPQDRVGSGQPDRPEVVAEAGHDGGAP
jgi:hypothetical protein